MPHTQPWIGVGLEPHLCQHARLHHARRLMNVVEQRRRPGEPKAAHQVLAIQLAAGLSKDRVPFARHLAETMINWHRLSPFVILSAAKNLGSAAETLRSAQGDMLKPR